ncbi:anaerobic sulfatase maturase [Streptomyces sp. CC210A]|uniref:anaerobic sulfatase maturase n=1 Tax=Streptomyces sp. CC210A TaxID=2898184 RepID=UPI001F35C452|nr:anaerobic sulfatase maturase [Streptomyces sp. CC210A]
MSTVDLPDPTVRRRPFHLLAKPTGAVCNLDCTYCFFLSKEMLYGGSRFRMADDLLDAYLRQLTEAHGPSPEVTVAWQGGEPTLMGLDFFRRSVELARRYARPGQRIVHTLQTNGTLLDADWARFLKDNGFLVGLSVDGPRALHDAYRVDKGGKPTFDRVMRGLRHLREHGVQWNALTTLHAANAGHGREVYAFLRDDCGAEHVQFIPIVERATAQDLPLADAGWGARAAERPLYRQQGDRVTSRSVTGEQYGRFLIDVFEDWVRRDIGRVHVQMFDVALANWYGEQPSLCVHSRTCGSALALEHNGDVYSCDHFVEPGHLLGTIRERHLLELVDSPQQRRFGQDKYDTLPRQCLDCDVRFACHGGCPKDRFATTGDGEPGLNHLCAGFTAFFHHVDGPMRAMADLLHQGRAPALLMRAYAAADAHRPHNAPCPCGGGRKWARCHGRPAAASAPV